MDNTLNDPYRKIEMIDLQPGTIVRHRMSGDAFVVTANYREYAIAVRTQHISNPEEWTIEET